MKKSVKIAGLVLGAVMLAGSFSGCGNKSASGDVTELTYWSSNTAYKDQLAEMIDNYNKTIGKEAGVKVNLDTKEGGSISNNLDLAFQSGEAPDFFDAGNLAKLADAGQLLAINDMPGGDEIIEKYKGKLKEGRAKYKDKVYAIPTSTTPQGLIYNKDMFKAAGIVDENGEAKPPETFDEMREYAKRLTDVSKKKYGMILPMKWGNWFASDIGNPMQSSAGYTGYNPVTDDYDYSMLVPIMKTYLGMKEDGSIYPGAESLDNDPARAAFATGNVGMKMGYSFDVGVYNDQFPANFDWGVAPYPVVDKNNKYKQRMDYDYSVRINKDVLSHASMDQVMSVWNYLTGKEYIQEMYKKGCIIPADPSLVEGVSIEVNKKGYEEFAQLVKISSAEADEPKYDSSGLVKISERFLNDVWSGRKTPEQVTEEYTEDMRKGRAEYYKTHTELDSSAYKNPDWNIKR